MLEFWRRKKTEKAEEIGSKEKLCNIFNEYAGDTSPFVHLAVDLQKYFSRGEEKEAIARNIGRSIAPAFNELSIPTYWIYYRDPHEQFMDDEFCQLGPFEAYGGLYESIKPAANDSFIRKHRDSAFAGSNIHDLLQKDGKKILLVTGFNYHACILDTVIDARNHDYSVILLQDNTNYCRYSVWEREMKKKGVIHAQSQDLLNHLRR